MQKRFILKCISLFILFSNKVDEPEVVPRSWKRAIWRDESDGSWGWGEEGKKVIQPFVICFPSLISLLHNNVARMVTNRHLHSWDMRSYSFNFQFRQFEFKDFFFFLFLLLLAVFLLLCPCPLRFTQPNLDSRGENSHAAWLRVAPAGTVRMTGDKLPNLHTSTITSLIQRETELWEWGRCRS